MKKITIIISLLVMASISFAQGLVNNGATIGINSETYLAVVNLGLTNQASGVIDLNGFLTVEGDLLNNASFNINSDASLLNQGSVSGTGTTNVKRKLSANQVHYISQAVTDASVSDFTGGFVFEYSEENSDWQALTTGVLKAMKAYSVEFLTEKTVTFSGITNTGAQSINVTNIDGGWYLVGNPYPSAIDWNAVAGWTRPNIDKTIYFWNGTNYSYYKGTNGATSNGPELFINDATNIIAPMQGFFVKASDNGQMATTNEVRLHNDTQAFYKSEQKSNINVPFIRLAAKGNDFEDEALVAFIPESSSEFDSDFDAYKLFTTVKKVPQICTSTAQGKELAINSLPEFNNELVIDCNFTAGENGTYSISVKELNLENISKIYLEDKKLSKFTELSLNDKYTFDYLISDNSDRFKVHFTKSVLGIDEATAFESNINMFAIAKEVHIQSVAMENSKAVFSVYDLSGKMLMQKKLVLNTENIVSLKTLSGTYLLKLSVDGKETTQKVFIK